MEPKRPWELHVMTLRPEEPKSPEMEEGLVGDPLGDLSKHAEEGEAEEEERLLCC